MTTYFVRPGRDRPEFRLVITFLWGDDEDVDTDGDSDTPASRKWTELWIERRSGERESVDVSPSRRKPLVLRVESTRPEMAARVAFFLATATEGMVAKQADGPFKTADVLVSALGRDFDLALAMERVRRSRLGAASDEDWLAAYRRRWPKGLVRYSVVDAELPEAARRFLADVGLPTGREPEWVFSGRLQRRALGQGVFHQFGLWGVAPLLLSPDGSVWLLGAEGAEPSYWNGSIEQFAQCLTLACKGDRSLVLDGLSVPALVARVRERYEEIDQTCMKPGTRWTRVLEDVEEAARERRGDFDP